MQDVILELPFPPTVNSYYVKTQRGVYISKQGRIFRERVADACAEQSCYNKLIDHKIEVDVILYPPDARKRDLDNYMKALLDALTQAKVWRDDMLIDKLTAHRGAKSAGGATYLRIKEHHGFIMPLLPTVWDHIE